MENNYSKKNSKVKFNHYLLVFSILIATFFTNGKLIAQNYELVTVTGVASGSGTDNTLFNVTSPTIPSLAYIRAERIAGPAVGNFTQSGDNIRYRISSATSGIPNNYSRIRYSFLQADGVTPIPVNDFRFVINDIDGPNNEALATDCGANVRFSATAIPTNLLIDNTPPDLNAVGTQNESNGPTSRVMYEFNDVSVIEFDNYANNGYLKDFDMNDNDFPIGTPLYAVCLGDNDNDGVTDDMDLDDDNDGILDVVEAGGNDPNGDADGDGLPNYLDTSDDFGVSGAYTPDGSTTDYTDANSDGVPDVYEASADADSLPNHLDTDSDNDGCMDVDEVYGSGTDADADGQYGLGLPAVDANGLVIAAGITGATYNTLPSDNDLNGTDDYLQASVAVTGITTQPVDATAIPVNDVTFNVVVTTSGTGTAEQYQWQEQVNGVGSWTNLINGGNYSNVTTSSLTIAINNHSLDGNLYRVVISTPAYVCDSDQISNSALLTVSNTAPVAVDDTASTNEDTAVTLSNADIVDPNDTDLDGDTLTITGVSNPTNGTIVLNGDGTVTFTPDANYNGPASFDYTISDGNGGTDTATVNVTVNPVNDAPVAVDDTASTNEDTAVTLSNADIVDPNDTDLDGDTLTITGVSNPTNGTIVLNGDGTVTFTPDANYNGPASFDYTISDGNGGSDTATVTVTVNPVNDAPVAVDDTASTNEDIPVVIAVINNDTDIDGTVDPTSVTVVTPPANGTLSVNTTTGEITYTPNLNFSGTDTFEYSVCDNEGACDTGIVAITIIEDMSDLSMVKTVDNITPNVGENIEFTITLSNDGPNDATGVSVIDQLTSGYSFISYTASLGDYDSTTGIWNVGIVGNGANETLTIRAMVNASGDYTNIAEVYSANQADPNSIPGNGDASENDQDEITTVPVAMVTFPEEFTPNGDGINDLFEIRYLQVIYPNFSMEIVNRYGNIVYKYKHDGNPNSIPLWWNGFSDGRWNFSNKELPVGTYFYTIYFNNNNKRKPQTGWIYLRK
ncbi:Ig-like domain-containing protein [Lutibacter sp.]|uniref:Ig-like domain-containing protein n=1 Tax=Lutibacter sp. TaxID=1925666 RepID=UPI0025BF0774|nr:Ig-like domain-containing protein [Lutibacter sp.]MCF6182500.1 Ig-like domain-containing protein [Lutibacter sp.]